ncbi:MAG TPA: class I SAM-dependent methyltransferase [Spirochaetota bacterium]|nr:class I SAM-dependent methyltransferase [Spirochaetota bacterium]
MNPYLNSTADYHRRHMESLGWELTVCNMLQQPSSPCRRILAGNRTYGSHLEEFLSRHIDWNRVHRVLEVGGGYGYLMRDLVEAHPHLDAVMLDISPFLLERQRETLGENRAEFLLQDFLEFDAGLLNGLDLAILNENIGDFPALCNLTAKALGGTGGSSELETARRLIRDYGLDHPDGPFVFNLGAALAVEKLCGERVRTLYLSEHSCEAVVPPQYRPLIPMPSPGTPERIRLKGHDEYTVKFAHLERIARAMGYECLRGPFADFLHVEWTNEVRFIMTSRSGRDDHEAIRQFIEDLYRYEYLLLLRSE